MFFRFARFLMFGVVLATSVRFADAHPISLSSAVANVQSNKVSVELRILVEDLVLYQGLKPDGTTHPAEQLRTAARAHETLLLEDFTIRDFDGEKLAGEIANRDFEDIPDEGVAAADLMAHALVYEIEFPTEEPATFLTFLQSFGGSASPIPSVMDLVVFQSGVWTDETVQLSSGRPHVFEFDWTKAPQPVPKSWAERKRQREARQSQMLGITSYSSVYSYIYVTDREIRHEILVPLLTLETWISLDREDDQFLEIEEQHTAREAIARYFEENHPVHIDGVRVQPVLDRVDFYGLDIRDFAQQAPERRVSVYNARAGIILAYPCKTPPNSLALAWEEFNPSTPFLKSIIYEFREKGRQHFIVPDDPVFEWGRSDAAETIALRDVPVPTPVPNISVPVFSAMLIAVAVLIAGWRSIRGSRGVLRKSLLLPTVLVAVALFGTKWRVEMRDPFFEAPRLSEEETRAVFEPLLANIYRAFDYNGEEAVYGALAESVEGNLLRDLYLKIREGLVMQEQGGAASHVESVEINSVELENQSDESGVANLIVVADWKVEGSVEHWGHVHKRINGYRAGFSVVASGGAWKISQMEVEVGKRLGFETSLREWK